jgi:hypothetical protein
MALFGLAAASNLADVTDRERAWDNLGLNISADFNFDPDAENYIRAVEVADNASLEPSVQFAINNFIVGCKADGIWTAIKASCILAGARTLTGALVPLVGTAPTNFNFVSGDYNRETGLVGNGASKYLNSNRAANADPQNSIHLACFKTNTLLTGALMGSVTAPYDLLDNEGGTLRAFSRNNGTPTGIAAISMTGVTGFMGWSRESASQVTIRGSSMSLTGSSTSNTPSSVSLHVFSRSNNNAPQSISSSRIAFYSIGESLNLALLDARVTSLINAFAASIP